MATSEDLSKRLSEIYRRIDELKTSDLKDPDLVQKVLSSAINELETSLEELTSAEEELCQQNEELEEAAEAREKYIAEISEANEVLKRQSEMLERSPVLIRDLDDRIITWCQGVEELYGWTAEEALGKISHDIFRTEFPEPLADIKTKVLRDGLWSGELSHITRDGSRIFVASQWVLHRDGSGKPSAIIEVNNDITERKQAEEVLRLSEEKFAKAFSNNPAAVALTRLEDGVFLDVNDTWVDVNGYSRDEAIGRSAGTLPIWPTAEARARFVKELQEKGCIRGWEQEFRRKSGEIFVAQLWAQVLTVGGKQVVLSTLVDITEHKRAKSEIESLAKFPDENPSPVLRVAADGTILYANRNSNPLLGLWGCLVGQKLPGGYRSIVLETLKSGRSSELEVKSGSATYLLVLSPIVDMGYVNIYGKDITQRKRMEEALQESEAKYRAFFENSMDAILITDPSGGIEAVNEATCRMFGMTKDEIIKGGRYAIVDASDPRLEPALEERKRTGRFRGELNFKRKDGTIFPVDEANAVFTDRNGKQKTVMILRDMTERKQAEEALHRSNDDLERRVWKRTAELAKANEELMKAKEDEEVINEELQVELEQHKKLEADLIKAKNQALEAVEAKAAFLANMSHELRTPMNAVIGFSSLLMEENLTPDQKDYIERIRVGGESLLAIINDILDFSKMEKKKVGLEHQTLSLRSLVEESMAMVAVQAEDKGINLSVTISYGTPDTIIGDQGRLRQILINLLSNAVKFTDAGEVSVSISSKAIEGNKHQILFAVRDTGIGIPKDSLGKLFLPFSQAQASISSQRGGTGLGLAISKRLVELMGGRIWADSIPEVGSTFSFTIEAEVAPGKIADSGRHANAAYENLAEQKPMRILVAEDVPSNQKVLVEMLRRMGYRADMAADGFEVLQSLERQPYDLILMDVKMPEMDGIAATREIRRRFPAEKQPRIIAITAYAMEGDREKCIEAGMDDYIAKPVQKGELASLLRGMP